MTWNNPAVGALIILGLLFGGMLALSLAKESGTSILSADLIAKRKLTIKSVIPASIVYAAVGLAFTFGFFSLVIYFFPDGIRNHQFALAVLAPIVPTFMALMTRWYLKRCGEICRRSGFVCPHCGEQLLLAKKLNSKGICPKCGKSVV